MSQQGNLKLERSWSEQHVLFALCRAGEGNESPPSEDEIVQYLKGRTLVGLLPVPHPIFVRKYQPNERTAGASILRR